MDASSPIRILLVDDHTVVREGLQAMLDSEPDFEVVGQAETAEESIRRVAHDEPDLVVMDIQLPDATGVDACREIRSRWPDVTVPHAHLLRRRRSAPCGDPCRRRRLPPRIRPQQLIDGIRRAAAGESLLDPDVIDLVFRRIRGEVPGDPLLERITPQELNVLQLIEQGRTNREIGDELFLAEKTVKNYVSNMLAKLGMSRRSEAAAYAARRRAQTEQRFPAGSWEELHEA